MPFAVPQEQSAGLAAAREHNVLNQTKKQLVLTALDEATGSPIEAARLLALRAQMLVASRYRSSYLPKQGWVLPYESWISRSDFRARNVTRLLSPRSSELHLIGNYSGLLHLWCNSAL